MLPDGVLQEGKVIYLMRNPKDTVVSWYHFQRMNKLYQFQGDFDDFFDLFLTHKTPYGSYWENVHSWWAHGDRDNVLLLTYEALHEDLEREVRKVADFLGRRLSDEQIVAIANHANFEQMKANPMTSASSMPKVQGETDFMRKGKVGDWKNYLSAAQDARMNAWIAEYNKEYDLPLQFDV